MYSLKKSNVLNVIWTHKKWTHYHPSHYRRMRIKREFTTMFIDFFYFYDF